MDRSIFTQIVDFYLVLSIVFPFFTLLYVLYFKKYVPKNIFFIITFLLFASTFADVLFYISKQLDWPHFFGGVVKVTFRTVYLLTIIYFYHQTTSSLKSKKIYLILGLFMLVISLTTIYYNFLVDEWLFRYTGIYTILSLLPISIYRLFKINNDSNKNFKYHYDPIFIFNAAVFINLGFSLLYNLFEITLANFHLFMYHITTLLMWIGWIFYYFILAYGISNYKKIHDNQVDSPT